MAMQIAKGVLVIAGLVVFLLGIQSGQDMLRWTGIGLVAVAWSLRFIKPKSSTEDR